MANAITAAAVNPGFLASNLVPNRTSRQSECMWGPRSGEATLSPLDEKRGQDVCRAAEERQETGPGWRRLPHVSPAAVSGRSPEFRVRGAVNRLEQHD